MIAPVAVFHFTSPRPSLRPPPIAVILLVLFVDVLCYSMVAPLLPLYVGQLGLAGVPTAPVAGALAALYAAMQLISGPLLGGLSDRHGRKPVLLACILGTALSFALLAAVHTLPALVLAVLLDGLTGGNLTVAYAYLADVSPPERRAQRLALAGAALGLGVMTGPALGGVISATGLYVPAQAAFGLALTNIAVGLLLLPESLPASQRIQQRQAAHGLHARGLVRMLFDLRSVSWLLFSIFAANLAFGGLHSNFPLYSRQRFAWTPRDTGYLFAFVGLCAVITQGVVLRALQPRLGDRRLVTGGLAVLAAGLAGIALATQGWHLFPAAALAVFGSGISLPTLSALASTRLRADQQGLLMGSTQTLLAAANIAAPLLAGAAFEWLAPGAPYGLGAVFAAIALLAAQRALAPTITAPSTPTSTS